MRGASLDISQSLTIQIVGWSEVGIRKLIEPRLYRAAFLPALLAAVIAAFSLESPPRPVPPGLAADGGARGDVGARRFADAETAAGRQVDAVIVLSNTGAAHSHGPLVIDWSNDSTRGSLGLRRTASDALRAELGTDGGGAASAPAQ